MNDFSLASADTQAITLIEDSYPGVNECNRDVTSIGACACALTAQAAAE